jgi:hypothetical protein
MEWTCSRCHRTVEDGDTYCPACGLPQLTYSTENSQEPGQPERWTQVVQDSGSVQWRSALRSTLPIAIPAGMLCSVLSPASIVGLLLMGATAAWAVALYVRGQRPAWVTVGAGARIGFVTGIVGGWTAAASTGLSLYALRYWMHQGSMFDNFWSNLVNQQMVQEWNAVGADAQTVNTLKNMMLSPEGRAGWVLFAIAFLMVTLILFAIAGGALSARFLTRPRRSAN